MHVLITGGAGLVGTAAAKRFSERNHTVTITTHEKEPPVVPDSSVQFDVTNEQVVQDTVSDVNPDTIVHTASLVDADNCEEDPLEAWRVNVEGTRIITDAAVRNESNLIFISSSFVFDGNKKFYNEFDKMSPLNVYGETKVAAERIVDAAPIQSAVIRTDQPYGTTHPEQHDTMITWTLEQLNNNEKIPVFEDWSNNPVHVFDLADAIVSISMQNKNGPFHAVGTEHINRYEWAKIIAGEFGYDQNKIKPVNSKNSDARATRPNSYLKINRLKRTINWQPVNIDKGTKQARNSNSYLAWVDQL